MTKKSGNQQWSELDELEDKALGMFVGGLLLDVDPDALSKEPVGVPPGGFGNVEAFLDSIGARRLSPKKAQTVEEMKKEIKSFFETNAQAAMLMARNFQSFPDEAVKSIYDEFLELQERVARRG